MGAQEQLDKAVMQRKRACLETPERASRSNFGTMNVSPSRTAAIGTRQAVICVDAILASHRGAPAPETGQ